MGRIKRTITRERSRILGTIPYEGPFSLNNNYPVKSLVANTRSNPEYPLEIKTKAQLKKLMQLSELEITENLEVRPDYGDRHISKN